jgi:hypothetical protein
MTDRKRTVTRRTITRTTNYAGDTVEEIVEEDITPVLPTQCQCGCPLSVHVAKRGMCSRCAHG